MSNRTQSFLQYSVWVRKKKSTSTLSTAANCFSGKSKWLEDSWVNKVAGAKLFDWKPECFSEILLTLKKPAHELHIETKQKRANNPWDFKLILSPPQFQSYSQRTQRIKPNYFNDSRIKISPWPSPQKNSCFLLTSSFPKNPRQGYSFMWTLHSICQCAIKVLLYFSFFQRLCFCTLCKNMIW